MPRDEEKDEPFRDSDEIKSSLEDIEDEGSLNPVVVAFLKVRYNCSFRIANLGYFPSLGLSTACREPG